MLAESFRDLCVAHLKARNKLVAEDLKFFKNVILFNVHVVLEKRSFNTLRRHVAMLEALAIRQIACLLYVRGRHIDVLDESELAVLRMNMFEHNFRDVVVSHFVYLHTANLDLEGKLL